MKGMGDLGGVGQHRVEDRLVGVRQVQRRPADPGPPLLGAGGEPGARLDGVATWDDVEQPAVADVDDLGRPALRSVLAFTDVEGLVQPDGVGVADAIRIVVDEGGAVGDDGVVDGVPVTGQSRRRPR